MGLDTGTIIIIAAVLIFYLRLIIVQRQKAKLLRSAAASSPSRGKKKTKNSNQAPAQQLSILSNRKQDWIIAGLGAFLMVAGILLNRLGSPESAAQAYWWLPMAIGIVGFSWAFR